MMKIGCMSLSIRNIDMDTFIQTVYNWGLDIIELHTSIFASTEPNYLREIKLKCLKKGLPIGYIGISNNFGKPQNQIAGEVELIKKWVDISAYMSVPLVRIFAAYIPANITDEESLWPPMINCMKEVAEYGEKKGVVIGLQNHNHHNVTRTGDDVLRILREVNNPYFSHILDTGQYAGSPGSSGQKEASHPKYDFYKSIEQTAPYATYVRTKFYRVDSGVEEWLDYPKIFRILRNVGYNGSLSIVYEGESEALPAIEKAAKYLRRMI